MVFNGTRPSSRVILDLDLNLNSSLKIFWWKICCFLAGAANAKVNIMLHRLPRGPSYYCSPAKAVQTRNHLPNALSPWAGASGQPGQPRLPAQLQGRKRKSAPKFETRYFLKSLHVQFEDHENYNFSSLIFKFWFSKDYNRFWVIKKVFLQF